MTKRDQTMEKQIEKICREKDYWYSINFSPKNGYSFILSIDLKSDVIESEYYKNEFQTKIALLGELRPMAKELFETVLSKVCQPIKQKKPYIKKMVNEKVRYIKPD